MNSRRTHKTLRSSRCVLTAPVLLVFVPLVFVVSGCNLAGPFEEYQGANILASRGLTLADATDGYLRGETASHRYVTVEELTPTQYGTSDGLPADVAVYRLEVPNLLPDGDFESGTTGAWDAVTATDFTVTDAGALPDNNYLRFEVAPGTFARIDLNDAVGGGLTDGLVANATYHLQFVTRREDDTASIVLDYGNATSTSYVRLYQADLDWIFRQDPNVTGTPTEHFRGTGVFDRPTSFVTSDTNDDYLYIGSPRSGVPLTTGYLDNVRIGRIDNFPHAVFALPATTDTGLEIVPGVYELSVYVKAEIDSQVTPAPDGVNRYRATQISLGNNDRFQTFAAADVGWTPDMWQPITARLRISREELQDDPIFRVQLAPGSIANPEVGSILVTEPTLTLVQQ